MYNVLITVFSLGSVPGFVLSGLRPRGLARGSHERRTAVTERAAMTAPSDGQLQVTATSVMAFLTSLAIFPGRSDGGVWAETGPLSRPKRHILQLCTLISVHTNRACFDYNNYGCFCGLGNADSSPVDAADSCCRSHDHCYANSQCFWLYPHFVGYSYECTSAGCQCTDSPTLSLCSYSTCKCDLKLARCLGKTPFNPSFSSYNRDQCPKSRSSSSSSSSKRKRKKKSVKKIKARRLKKQKQGGNGNGKENNTGSENNSNQLSELDSYVKQLS